MTKFFKLGHRQKADCLGQFSTKCDQVTDYFIYIHEER